MAAYVGNGEIRTDEYKAKIKAFIELVGDQTKARAFIEYPNSSKDPKFYKVQAVEGKKYTKVDVGTSGKFMIDIKTEMIFGIKGYGVIHKGKMYGNLDTINDWYWGNYVPVRRCLKVED